MLKVMPCFLWIFMQAVVCNGVMASQSYLDYDEDNIRQEGAQYASQAQKDYEAYEEMTYYSDDSQKMRELLLSAALKGHTGAQYDLTLGAWGDEFLGWSLILARRDPNTSAAEILQEVCPEALATAPLSKAHTVLRKEIDGIISDESQYEAIRSLGLGFQDFLTSARFG